VTSDSEGYTCVMRGHRWVIVDRYGRPVDGELAHDDHGPARQRVDDMNDDYIARRLADSMERRS